ncbi:MAG: MCP four helix bundle domain-containing protein, partial [Caulobacteraceae bacterium]|nr:MCP four helix bundle domain-containing protein [Caulobacteraceae bacterium]
MLRSIRPPGVARLGVRLATRTISGRLSWAFGGLVLLMVILGAFSLDRLAIVDVSSSAIRDRWLPATRFLGDLSNYMSDMRTAEGAHILAPTSEEMGALDVEIASLGEIVDRSMTSYQNIPPPSDQLELYRAFSGEWATYLTVSRHARALSGAGQKEEARQLYRGASRAAFARASDTLAQLTDRNLVGAAHASERSKAIYKSSLGSVVGLVVVAAALAGAAAAYVARAISVPLGQLSADMRRLARNETDLENKAAKRRDEVGEMARSVAVFRDNAVRLI